MRCYDCGEDDLRENEVAVSDGNLCLCEECARWHSNRIYDKLLGSFTDEEEIYREAFLKYGWDDLACTLDEERKK